MSRGPSAVSRGDTQIDSTQRSTDAESSQRVVPQRTLNVQDIHHLPFAPRCLSRAEFGPTILDLPPLRSSRSILANHRFDILALHGPNKHPAHNDRPEVLKYLNFNLIPFV